MGVGVDWSALPQEIIELISKSITIYADYLRFRCVCRSWNSFLDLSANKIHRINLPPPSWTTSLICGSSYGWLVILNETEVTLLNPVTGATLSLPSLNTCTDLVAMIFHHSYKNLHLIKVVLSSNPSSLSDDDDFVAFAILNNRHFVFCKKGYHSWVRLRVSQNNHTWTDVVYKNGSFFVMSMDGIIAVCDLEGSRVFLHENISISHYFINTCYTVLTGEDMLLVVNQIDYMQSGFMIFKMNWNVLEWEEIQTLGEYSLFIGNNSSLCFSAADFVGCLPNCIYFTKSDFGFGIYNLSNRKALPCYPRNLNFGFGYPIWVTPNPC